MLEPVSTITNIAFIIVGLIIFGKSWYVSLVTIIMGLASAGWHWTLDTTWRSFDVIMMNFMLISLIDYAEGSRYTVVAFLAGLALIGLHFLIPSHILILVIGFVLLIALIRNYPLHRIVLIVLWFFFWIMTNIPYLHEWSFSVTTLDVLHGISHLCASVGIYLTVKYRPSELSGKQDLTPNVDVGVKEI